MFSITYIFTFREREGKKKKLYLKPKIFSAKLTNTGNSIAASDINKITEQNTFKNFECRKIKFKSSQGFTQHHLIEDLQVFTSN